MKKRLIIFSSVITATALVLLFAVSLIVSQYNNEKIAKQTIINYTKIYAQNYNSQPIKELDENIRVTVIDSSGNVLSDSKPIDIEHAENHLMRPEVQSAINDNPKVEKRYSDTLAMKMLYYAEKVDINDDFVIVRVAIPTSNINSLAYTNISILLVILLIVIILSVFASTSFSRSMLTPFSMVKDNLTAINDGNFITIMPTSNYDEINAMLLEINDISGKLKNTVDETQKNSELRAEFFANASHELKTPLTSIKGFNELLELSNTDEKLSPHIAQIKKESERMLTLIDDMLRLSSLENQKQLEKSKIDLVKISKEVSETLKPLLTEKQIKFEINGSGTVLAEYSHMYDLIKNLSENAVKYNVLSGKVSIFVKEYKNKTTFEIADTGIGIEEKHHARIFERFYRIEKSRSRTSGGTGLGLSIVKHICAKYSAQLTLKSQIGKGTTIIIEFNNN